MSRIDDLMEELAPEGVQFKTLGDISIKVSSGGTPASGRSEYYGGTIPWLRTQEVNYTDITSTGMTITEEGLGSSSAKWIPAHCVIVAMYGATAAKVAINAIPLTTNQACCNLQIDPKQAEYRFVFHWVANEYERLKALGEGSQSNLNGQKVKQYPIPVPPLEVQREIVRVLDTFSSLDADLAAELSTELEARRRQYAYWRDDLFAFRDGNSVRRVPMGEVGEFIRGRRFTKNDIVDEGIPSIHYGEIYTTYGIATDEAASHVRKDLAPQLRYAKPCDVVIAAVGETVEDVGKGVAWLGATDVAIHDDCFLYRSSQLDAKFVSYYLRTSELNRSKAKYVARAKVNRLSGENLAKLLIPVPKLDEQERIVSILDNFDTLLADLSAALPAELAARRKQYEYYRENLLTFREAIA